MPADPPDDRLSRLSTDWDALRDAHAAGGSADDRAARAAQELLLLRYGPAVRRYLGRVAGGDADELFQEFGVAVLEGKLRTADPGKGRFRDFVKAVVRHLAARHHARRTRGPRPAADGELAAVAAPGPADDALDEAWRDNLLVRAWSALADADPRAYEVLRLRADHPHLRSGDLAARLADRAGKPVTAEAVRQALARARKRFARLLVAEVEQSVAGATPELVARELADLGLLEYCRPALADRGGA